MSLLKRIADKMPSPELTEKQQRISTIFTGVILLIGLGLFPVGDQPVTVALCAIALVVLLIAPNKPYPYFIGASGYLIGLSQVDILRHTAEPTLYFFALVVMGLAVAFAHNAHNVIKVSFRYLLGIMALFAGLQKILVPEFRDGSVFEFVFMTYSNIFAGSIDLIPGISGYEDKATTAGSELTETMLTGGEGAIYNLEMLRLVEAVSQPLAVSAIIIDLLLAAVMLLPLKNKWVYLRDVAAAFFVVSHYALSPVITFGIIIVVLASGASSLKPKPRIILYSTLFAFLIARLIAGIVS